MGGAAIALLWNPRRTTYDVDVVSEGVPSVFWDVVAVVGREERLEDGWLNAAARVRAPTGTTPGEPSVVYLGSNLRVYGASAHYVLAMKLLAGRETDRKDTPDLLEAVQPQSRDALYDLVEQAYPTAQIPASTGYIIDQVWDDYTAVHPELAQSEASAAKVHVRRYQLHNHGWEVATTGPDGSPRQLSGRHPTAGEAEAARDFLVRLVNGHPRLHILGSDPQRSVESDVGSAAAPPAGEPPTVGLYSPDQAGRWYVQCRNPDGTVHDSSPPYPTYQAAANVLDQLGMLIVATADRDIGHRAVVEPTSSACRCSRKGWRCGHIEPPEPEPPDRGHGLSL